MDFKKDQVEVFHVKTNYYSDTRILCLLSIHEDMQRVVVVCS